MRLYLDEMFSPEPANQLRRLGVDAISALEVGHVSIPDETHLRYAGETRRCLVTQNYSHFVRHTDEFAARGLPHAGLLLVPKSVSTRHYGILVRALSGVAADHPEDLPPYTILWLPIAGAE